MKIIKKQTAFRYISYEIQDYDNKYIAIKSFGLPASEEITIRDENNNLIEDKIIIDKINKAILEYNF